MLIDNITSCREIVKPILNYGYAKNRPELAEIALRYLDEGAVPIPIKLFSKQPALGSWKQFQARKPTTANILSFFRESQNIGVICGKASRGLLVADVDGLGWEKIGNSFLLAFPFLQVTRMVTTGGGRLHVWFRCRSLPDHVTRMVRTFSDGQIELRGNGHYVVAPPSIHPNGKPYRWVKESAPIVEISSAQLEAILAWFREGKEEDKPLGTPYLGPLKGSSDEETALGRAIATARPGCRNVTGFSLALKLRDLGVPEEQARVIMLRYASGDHARRGDHPYRVSEAMASLRQAYRYPAVTKKGLSEKPLWKSKTNCSYGKSGHKPPESFCGKVVFVMKGRGTGKVVVRKYLCGRFGCPKCWPFVKRRKWKIYLETFPGEVWYLEVRATKDYESLTKRITRHGFVYRAIKNPLTEEYVIFTEGPLEGLKPIDKKGFADIFDRYATMPQDGKAGRKMFRCSRRLVEKKPKPDEEFDLFFVPTGDVQYVARKLMEKGCEQPIQTRSDEVKLTSTEKVERFFRALSDPTKLIPIFSWEDPFSFITPLRYTSAAEIKRASESVEALMKEGP